MSPIPKIIHQLWLQSEKYVPAKFQKYALQIKNTHPDFQYMFWDENKILFLIKDNEKYMKTYYSFTYMHQKIDFAKYIILYTFGGIFIDMDAYTIKSLNSLYATKTESNKTIQDYDVVVSYVTGNTMELMIICRQTKCVNNGNILAKPGADFMKYLIDKILEQDTCGYFTPKILCISNTTGPILINDAIKKYKGPSTIKILDAEYIEPCVTDNCNVTDNTYIVHKHARTWIAGPARCIIDFYLKYKMTILIIIIFVILFITGTYIGVIPYIF